MRTTWPTTTGPTTTRGWDRTANLLALLALGLAAPFTPVPAAPPAPAPEVRTPAFVPTASVLTEIRDAATDRPAVALTFDDGPDPRWTPQILAALRRHGAVATFCVVSGDLGEHQDLVEAIVRDGHRLCDHTRTHDTSLPDRTPEQMTEEIVGARRDLAVAADVPVRYFRAPAGNWSPAIGELAAAHGMQPLGWSIDTRDWRRPGTAAIVAAVRDDVHPGAVVLLHDGGGERAQTVAAMEQVLPWLTARGYRFTFPTS